MLDDAKMISIFVILFTIGPGIINSFKTFAPVQDQMVAEVLSKMPMVSETFCKSIYFDMTDNKLYSGSSIPKILQETSWSGVISMRLGQELGEEFRFCSIHFWNLLGDSGKDFRLSARQKEVFL